MGGGVGLHYHDGWWYITSSGSCGNCVSSPMWYIMARDPMGDWYSPETMSSELPLQPAKLLDNVESSQIHGAKTVPDAEGNPQVLIPATHYRRDLGAPDASGNNSFADTGMFYFTLTYTEDGHIETPVIADTVEVALAAETETEQPAWYEAQLNITATDVFEHTDPADVTANVRMVQQSWELAEGETLACVLPSVYQKTPDYSDQGTTRPTNVVPVQDTSVNAPLHAKLELPDGTVYEWDIDPDTVRWAPSQVALNLPEAYTGAGRVTLTLSTEGTNGAYGTAVGFTADNEAYTLPGSVYRTYNEKEGGWVEREGVAMLVETSDTAVSAPVITVQPHDLTAVENGNGSFYVEAEGVGLGYRWLKNGEPIYSEYSAQSGLGSEATAPCFLLQLLTAEDAGEYSVEVFNSAGSVISEVATLTVAEGYSISGTVAIDGWQFYNGETETISGYNTIVQLYRLNDGVAEEQPCAETLVRGDGRYCFEVAYNGSMLSVDSMVARRFVPGTYMLRVATYSQGETWSTTEVIEITDADVAADLAIEGVPAK